MPSLTEEQKREALLILSIGCDRATAASYVGTSAASLEAATAEDRAFADAVARAEAAAEMAHMRNVQQAAKEEKNWRASVWWLERRLPDRYGRRNAESVTPGELKRFLAALAEAVAEEVSHPQDRERLLQRVRSLGVLEEPPFASPDDDEPNEAPEPNDASDTADQQQ